jgi:hypothetical protein
LFALPTGGRCGNTAPVTLFVVISNISELYWQLAICEPSERERERSEICFWVAAAISIHGHFQKLVHTCILPPLAFCVCHIATWRYIPCIVEVIDCEFFVIAKKFADKLIQV